MCLFILFLGGGDDIYSGLTFVGVNCEAAVFLNGLALQQVWFQVREMILFFSTIHYSHFYFMLSCFAHFLYFR